MSVPDHYIKHLKADRMNAVTEYRALLDKADAEHRDLSGEEKQTIDRLDHELDRLGEEIAHWESKRDAAYRADEARGPLEQFVRPATNLQFGRGDEMRTMFTRGGEHNVTFAGIRREVDNKTGAVEVRDLLVGTATAGGNTVPTSFYKQLYEHLIEQTAAFRLNTMIITTTGGENMTLPKSTLYGTATIIGEGTAIAENDPQFGTITLGAWKYARVLQISNEMLADTAVDIQGFISRDTSMAMSNAIGPDFINGSGSNKPTGIFNAGYGTGVTGQNGATGLPSYDNLVDMVHSVTAPYRTGAQWLWRDSALAGIRKIKDSQSRPLWEPSMQVGVPDSLFGYPVVTDPNVNALATGVLCGAFGNFNRGYVIRHTGMNIAVSPDYAFVNDLTTYRATWRLDGKAMDTAAVKYYRGGTA